MQYMRRTRDSIIIATLPTDHLHSLYNLFTYLHYGYSINLQIKNYE